MVTGIWFYGYSAELISDWCMVTIGTAYEYKSGRRRPSRQVRYLFDMRSKGLLLADAFEGWRVVNGVLLSPDGLAFTPGELNAHALLRVNTVTAPPHSGLVQAGTGWQHPLRFKV